MRTYTFYFETDNSFYNQPIVVDSNRLDNALDTFLKLVSSRAVFYRLTVFNYRVTSNGKSQNRHLNCPYHYRLIESKCVRYYPEMSDMFEAQKWTDANPRDEASFNSLLDKLEVVCDD